MTDNDYRFLKACRREPVDTTPVWIMRQAGRYMKEYRDVRARVSFLELCKTPELAAEVTITPVDKLGVDAAILFSDILIPVEAMGVPLRFDEGPILDEPVRSRADVDRLLVPDPVDTVPFVMDAIRLIRRELDGRVPVIGFAGAPFTLASYIVEGGSSTNFVKLKTLMFTQPETMHALLAKVADTIAAYLNAQIEAGTHAVQLFDSWAGCLSPRDFDEFALAYARRVIDQLDRSATPVIYFAQGGPALLKQAKQTGADVIGVDWRIEIGEARRQLGPDVAVQGNLDPCALFLPQEKIRERVKEIIDQAGDAGHIFNLGHGILPQTSVEHAVALVEAVHDLGRRTVSAGAGAGQG